jgi:outer membrane protein assembly factor BamA
VGTRARTCASLVVLIVAIGPVVVFAEDTEEAPVVPDDRTLEAQGAVIGSVTIHAASIFDTEDPKENKKILRAANKLHVTTRERVIRQQLTFKPGDRYSRAALDESERHLRHNGYLYDATIKPVYYDGEHVDVVVRTRDVWTLRPAIGFHRSGGTNAIHFGIHDANFLGFGKSVQVERTNNIDRVSTGIEYGDPSFARTHARLDLGYSNNSDGQSAELGFERPFWKSDEGWEAGVHAKTFLQTDSLWALGEITDQFQEQHLAVTASYGKRLPLPSPMTFRLIAGYTYDRSYFLPLPEVGYTTSLPPNLTLSYPWIGISLFREAYVSAHDMDKLGRTEDFNLGREFTARIGFSTPALGGDENAEIVELAWQAGFNPGAGQILTLDTSASGRITSAGLQNGILSGAVHYYHRDNDHCLLFIGLRGTAVDKLDGNHQLLLGGDNGLRGYPLRYATGDKSVLFTIEERFYFDREFFHVLRIGAAVFADVGRAWGEMPTPAAHLGELKDIGVGLRFGQTRSAHAGMIRVDVAVPFDRSDTGLRPQILITTGETF